MPVTDVNTPDERTDDLLTAVCERGPDYGAVLAHEAGLCPDEGRRRLERLAERGLVERVSEEPCYRATDRGSRAVGDAPSRDAAGA